MVSEGMRAGDGYFPLYNLPNYKLILGFRIFIIEGLVTIIVAFLAVWIIAPWPENAKFLNAEEKALLLERLTLDRGVADAEILTMPALKSILTDWKIWIGYG